MIELRRLSHDGLIEFRSYLSRVSDGAVESPPRELLEDPRTSEAAPVTPDLTDVQFESKRAAAVWLAGRLEGVPDPDLRADTGLWAALALWFFDQLAPTDETGKRNPGREVHYIPSGEWNRDYRHKLLAPYQVWRVHGDGARLLLDASVAQHGDWMEQLASRQEYVTNQTILDVADRLFFDGTRGHPKRGAQTRTKPGTLRRFTAVLQQLELTYDLYSLEPAELLNLLPDEFNRWIPDR